MKNTSAKKKTLSGYNSQNILSYPKAKEEPVVT